MFMIFILTSTLYYKLFSSSFKLPEKKSLVIFVLTSASLFPRYRSKEFRTYPRKNFDLSNDTNGKFIKKRDPRGHRALFGKWYESHVTSRHAVS